MRKRTVPEPAPLRDEPPLPDDAIVVRGGEMKHENLDVAAGTNFDEFGEYGLTVYSEEGLTAREIHAKYLSRYRKARVSTAGKIRQLQCELKPTHEPGHYDIVFPNQPSTDDFDRLGDIFDVRIERER
jgi:hypothetical protein